MWLLHLKRKLAADQTPQEWTDAHSSRLAKLREEGIIMASGRLGDGSGGYVLFDCAADEIEKYAKEDPFVQHGVSDYEYKEWLVTFSPKIKA